MSRVCAFSEFRFYNAAQMVSHHDFRYKRLGHFNADYREFFGNSGASLTAVALVVD